MKNERKVFRGISSRSFTNVFRACAEPENHRTAKVRGCGAGQGLGGTHRGEEKMPVAAPRLQPCTTSTNRPCWKSINCLELINLE